MGFICIRYGVRGTEVSISLRAIGFGERFLAEYYYLSERYLNCLTTGVEATERMVQLQVFEKAARISLLKGLCRSNNNESSKYS